MLAGKTPARAANAVGVARQVAYTWKARLDEGVSMPCARWSRADQRSSTSGNWTGCVPRRKDRWAMASAPSCGRSSVCAPLSSACMACGLATSL